MYDKVYEYIVGLVMLMVYVTVCPGTVVDGETLLERVMATGATVSEARAGELSLVRIVLSICVPRMNATAELLYTVVVEGELQQGKVTLYVSKAKVDAETVKVRVKFSVVPDCTTSPPARATLLYRALPDT